VKRNAQLADALGIRTDAKDKSGGITYPEQVVAFGRGNVKFVQVVEKAFAEYVGFDLIVLWDEVC
jgi:transcriptional repressor NF-X1